VVRPALLHVVGVGEDRPKLRFPGRLRASMRAELSFNVPGFVAAFDLPEGARVRAGQVLARLDDRVFQARVDAAQSEFDRARIDLERYQRLWESE
jgi:multidrug efflux pump subunit AcrA (membrane-fusion protein)